MKQSTPYQLIYTITETVEDTVIWDIVGRAYENKDGSLNLHFNPGVKLDLATMRLHIRAPRKQDTKAS